MDDHTAPFGAMTESKRAIEAIVLVASDPVPVQLLAQLLELPADTVEELCLELAASYDERGHGFRLVEVAGGWRYQTHPDLAPYVERFAMDGQSVRLSSAALETLAIVAYKQPISRAQVSAIRGVNVDAVLRTLLQRGYVTEVGRDTGVGQAVLFGTTDHFLERVGLRSTGELPALGDFVPAAEVVEALEATLRSDPDDDLEPPRDDQPEPVSASAVGATNGESPVGPTDRGERDRVQREKAAEDGGQPAADEGSAAAEPTGPAEPDPAGGVATEVIDLRQADTFHRSIDLRDAAGEDVEAPRHDAATDPELVVEAHRQAPAAEGEGMSDR